MLFAALQVFLAWGALTIGIEVLRARFAAGVLKRGYHIDPKRTHATFVGFAALAGAAITAGAVMFLPRLPLLHQALFGAILFAIPAAGAQKSLLLTHELTPVRVLGDPVAIGRIARNLIDNAIKYTERGTIRVTTHSEFLGHAPLAVLSVFDTGKGIPASEQGRIFEEFYQLDNPGRDRSKGVGLGLAIVQRLCELIGAKISVESVVGEGTCFRVTMPAILGETASSEPSLPMANDDSLRGKSMYVVDDELDILNSMRSLLGVWGVRVQTGDSSNAADRIFEQYGPPDLLIVDLRLDAEEHGARLAERLQQTYGSFPVLIITGETSSEALRQANERSDTLLQKPIAPEVLRRAIVTAVNSPRTVTL